MGEWPNKTIGDLVTLQRGIDLPDAKRNPGNVPIMGSFGITGWHNKTAVNGPGVTVGRSGASIGVVSYIDQDFWPLNTCLYAKDFHGNDPRFAYYFLKTLKLARLNSGSAQPSLNRNYVHPVLVSFPDPSEQRAIAAVLSALDDKIELNRRMNATLEGLARALFADWFVDFGPTRAKMALSANGAKNTQTSTDPYLAPEIWSLFPDRLDENGAPEGWEPQSVIDQAEWVNGAAYKNMHFNEAPDALPVIKIAELKAGVTQKTKWTNTALGEKYRIGNGELLFSWSGNPDTSIDAFIWTGGNAWLNQHIFAVRGNGTRTSAFLYTMLKWLNPEFSEIARNKQTTGLGHVTKKDLKRMQIHVGSNDILNEFEKLVGPIYARLQSNLTESRTLAQTRDLLLPRLMSGELRVREAEKLAEDMA